MDWWIEKTERMVKMEISGACNIIKYLLENRNVVLIKYDDKYKINEYIGIDKNHWREIWINDDGEFKMCVGNIYSENGKLYPITHSYQPFNMIYMLEKTWELKNAD